MRRNNLFCGKSSNYIQRDGLVQNILKTASLSITSYQTASFKQPFAHSATNDTATEGNDSVRWLVYSFIFHDYILEILSFSIMYRCCKKNDLHEQQNFFILIFFVGLEEFRKLVKDSKSTCALRPAGLFIASKVIVRLRICLNKRQNY